MNQYLRKLSDNLWLFEDICNVYLIVHNDKGLLIDSGSGEISSSLKTLGINHIEYILHTHHHRDQCLGDIKFIDAGTKVIVPEYERHLFEQAETFWQTRRIFDNYNNTNNFFTSAFNIPVHDVLEDYEFFTWYDYKFYVLPAKGHTHGSSALIVEVDGIKVSFTGDLMMEGGKLYQLHAMEYGYGAMEGILSTHQSIQALKKHNVSKCYPSHGKPIIDVQSNIEKLESRLNECLKLGPGIQVSGRVGPVSNPHFEFSTPLQKISDHLLWGGIWTASNFYVVLSDSGKALFIDYGHSYWAHMHIGPDHEGLNRMRFIEHHIDELFEVYGIKAIDVVIATHIHDDHVCGIPYLQKHLNTKCWALDKVGEVIESPSNWANLSCIFPKPVKIDRYFKDGEKFRWEEYNFQIFSAPGQTEFHSIISTEIDSTTIAFTGDNFFLHDVLINSKIESLAFQTTVFRNSFQLEMHQKCSKVLKKINPQLICPGHDEIIECNQKKIEEYCNYIERKEKIFRSLVNEPANHYIDLFWASIKPYFLITMPQKAIEFQLHIRNNFPHKTKFCAELNVPKGWSLVSGIQSCEVLPQAEAIFKFKTISSEVSENIRYIVTASISIDDRLQGPIAEAIVIVTN